MYYVSLVAWNLMLLLNLMFCDNYLQRPLLGIYIVRTIWKTEHNIWLQNSNRFEILQPCEIYVYFNFLQPFMFPDMTKTTTLLSETLLEVTSKK